MTLNSMPETLINGKYPEIKQANFKQLMTIGEPLVTHPQFGIRKAVVPGLMNSFGNRLDVANLWVETAGLKGGIYLHYGDLHLKPKISEDVISFFTFSARNIDDKVIFLARSVQTFTPSNVGFGTALAFLGDKLLVTMAPLISRKNNHKPVWAISYDTSFRQWTEKNLKELGYDFAEKINHQELIEFLKHSDENRHSLVKKLV